MLDHRPIRVLRDSEVAWPCPPLLGGPWRDVPSNIAAAIAAEGARRLDTRTMLPFPIERMRSLQLGFYPGWHLVEGLARYAVNAAGVFRMLVGPDELRLLEGSSPPIHELNAHHLQISDDPVADQYLRFFCGAIRGEEGPFRIVEDLSALAVNPAIGKAGVARVAKQVRPLKRHRDVAGDIHVATVVYGTTLYRSRFRVHGNGMVVMLEDEPVVPDVLAHAGKHDGIWEVFEEPACSAGRATS